MKKLLASFEITPLIEAIGTVCGGVGVFLLGIAFKAGSRSDRIDQHQKFIDELYQKVAAIEKKANEAQATAEAANRAVRDTLERVGGQYDEMRQTFSEVRSEMRGLNDKLFELVKEKK